MLPCDARTLVLHCSLVVLVQQLSFMVYALEPNKMSEREVVVPKKRLSGLLYGHFGTGYHCVNNGHYIFHGHVFKTSSCLSSRCFFGTSIIHSEGCEDLTGHCHGVNSVWTERCVSYKCQKTSKNGYNYYQPVVRVAMCRDAYGKCQRPGETFRVRMNDTVHDNCQCHIRDTMIHYRCVLQAA